MFVADGRLYRCTAAGKAALERQDASLPVEFRRVLGLIESDTHSDSLRTRLPNFSEAQIHHLLAKLVEQGLVETVAASADHDLDFTGNFSRSDLLPKR